MIQERKKKIIGILLIGANMAFIWGNSLMTGADSGALSGGILAWINSILGLGEAGAETLHLLIRKAAHFTEFACLGVLLAWNCRMSGLCGSRAVTLPLLIALLTACTDETIQIFVEGRGSSLLDVWVDTAGTLTGILILAIGYHLKKKHI